MKKIITILLSFTLSVLAFDDFEKGIDLSTKTAVTGAMLNQLVDNATVRTNRGIIIATNNVPDVVSNPRLKNYLWLDTRFDPPVLRTYSESLGWITATIPINSVNTYSITNYAITEPKIADGAVGTRAITNNAVTTEKIMDRSITSTKIVVSGVQRENIADGAIDGNKLTNNAVNTQHIVDGSITSSKIQNGVITSNHIANGSITTDKLQDYSVTTQKLAPYSVHANNIINGTITGEKLQDGIITTNKLASNLLLPSTAIKAFCFAVGNGNGNPQILSSYNISSIIRNGQGLFSVQFDNALSTTNYCVLIMPTYTSSGPYHLFPQVYGSPNMTKSTTYFQFRFVDHAWGLRDPGTDSFINIAVFDTQ